MHPRRCNLSFVSRNRTELQLQALSRLQVRTQPDGDPYRVVELPSRAEAIAQGACTLTRVCAEDPRLDGEQALLEHEPHALEADLLGHTALSVSDRNMAWPALWFRVNQRQIGCQGEDQTRN